MKNKMSGKMYSIKKKSPPKAKRKIKDSKYKRNIA